MAEMQHEFRRTPVRPKGPVVVTNNRLIPCVLLIDCIIAAGLIVLWYFLEYDPTNAFTVNVQEVMCNNLDHAKPYDPDERIPEAVVYVMVFLVPFVIILFGEAALSIYQVKVEDYTHQEKTVKTCGIKIHPMLRRTFRFTGMHVLGGFATWIIVDIGQLMIGRLTPHFLTICMDDLSDCTTINNNDECDSSGIPESCDDDDMKNCDYLNDARMSFPNTYAALSAYAAVYCGLYISSVFTITLTRLTRPFLVLGLLLLAYMAGLSEVAINQCFWSDVLIGYVIGATVGGYLGYFVLDYFKGKPQYSAHNFPTEMQDLVVMNPMHPVNKAAMTNDPIPDQPMKNSDVQTGPNRLSYTYDGSMGQVPLPTRKAQKSFLHSPDNYLASNGT